VAILITAIADLRELRASLEIDNTEAGSSALRG
jgi:hypothetical protein